MGRQAILVARMPISTSVILIFAPMFTSYLLPFVVTPGGHFHVVIVVVGSVDESPHATRAARGVLPGELLS